MVNSLKTVSCFFILTCLPAIGHATSIESLAKAAQNPIAAMISLPLQLNTNFKTGPHKKPLNILNIQPVVPLSLNQNWNLITRTIIPLVSAPAMTTEQRRVNGLGDIQMSFSLSPAQPLRSGWIVGTGVIGQAQTHTNNRLNDLATIL